MYSSALVCKCAKSCSNSRIEPGPSLYPVRAILRELLFIGSSGVDKAAAKVFCEPWPSSPRSTIRCLICFRKSLFFIALFYSFRMRYFMGRGEGGPLIASTEPGKRRIGLSVFPVIREGHRRPRYPDITGYQTNPIKRNLPKPHQTRGAEGAWPLRNPPPNPHQLMLGEIVHDYKRSSSCQGSPNSSGNNHFKRGIPVTSSRILANFDDGLLFRLLFLKRVSG